MYFNIINQLFFSHDLHTLHDMFETGENLVNKHLQSAGILEDNAQAERLSAKIYIYIYVSNCSEYCFGLLVLSNAVLMLGGRLSYKATTNDPTHVVSSEPCQSAQTIELVSMRNDLIKKLDQKK